MTFAYYNKALMAEQGLDIKSSNPDAVPHIEQAFAELTSIKMVSEVTYWLDLFPN